MYFAMKRMIFILLILTILLPVDASAMTAPYVPPESLENTPISLPFPVTDAPVGITFAALSLSWGENDTSTAPYSDAPYYPVWFDSEYTIRYDGGDPAVVEIAVPVLGLLKPNKVNILVDGKPVEYTFNQHEPDESNIGTDIALEYETTETTLVESLRTVINFEPNEECVLRVSFRPVTGMKWNEAEMQSLFYSTILTETANYWEFFDALKITTNYPEGVIESVIPEEFIEDGDNYVLDTQAVPGDNISIGFVMPDVRHDPPIEWILWYFYLFIITVKYSPITIAIILLVIYFVNCKIRSKAERKGAE
jgi:hypothetical protein